MRETKYLAGAFDAYGLADVIKTGRRFKVSLFTTSDYPTYVERFREYAGIGVVKTFRGRWHWACDDPAEVQQFYMAVGPHLNPEKRKLIEASWETWRRQTIEASDGEIDPGDIRGVLYPTLQEDVK